MNKLFEAEFIGEDEFPVLKSQAEGFTTPFQMIRFSDYKDASLNDAICFYEWDRRFINKLEDKKLHSVIPKLKMAGSVVQPDYSIYADEPLILQKMAVYNKNRVSVVLQDEGVEVIPNLRWGDERSFEFAFLGIPKNQICSIGTYGQIKDIEKKYLFEQGLEVALDTVEPKIVLIYGTMPRDIFEPYEKYVEFVRYPSWRELYSEVL